MEVIIYLFNNNINLNIYKNINKYYLLKFNILEIVWLCKVLNKFNNVMNIYNVRYFC